MLRLLLTKRLGKEKTILLAWGENQVEEIILVIAMLLTY
jgi:hypothetical protein